ncbi:unnamed protein product (macronuclear) [Paramecium tetraurelia]|uniref:Uncharacterized protein n=1 Tax=Paramecium tetraurelia TaxID=5888 RepID=A0DWJ1_PARTE|nr:uncharacterized protein GSPATT00021051001 [Paramecium tetraurelia]CAK87408.1 unnamed protein product [Paramecium tetraurelia]|eukprot:XP_001454805.1 hypothetical protein (macronuclear) [Paramecium tetraurelia strain d4-2]
MDQELIISPNDKKQYSLTTLPNQLECLIISDPNTKISGACLEICVGWLDDPKEYQGIAHFCEHMLFMGSEKYPTQNDYTSFIQLNSGSYNASTWLQRTKYHFSIQNDAFVGGLDRFAQFFICPLFDSSCIEREMNAVESEFNLSLADDQSRLWEIFVQQSDPESTFNRFGCGNLLTLNKPDIRDQLLAFYDKYYCSSLMKLVVYTDKSIQEVGQIVHDIFSLVPNKGRNKPLHLDNPFRGQFPKVDVVGIKQEDYLFLNFVIPNYEDKYLGQPESYITHVLGHEGQNSLASFLKDEGLVTELIVGSQRLNDKVSEIYLEIVLTEEGFQSYEKVIAFVFKQIEKIKEKGVKKEIFDELAQIKHLEFKFKENTSSVLEYIEKLSENMHKYPKNHIIYGEYAYEKYDPQSINEILKYLNPNNMIIFLRSPNFADEKDNEDFITEPFCKTRYRKQQISNSIFQIIKNCNNLKGVKTQKIIDIFPPNLYLPQNFDIIKETDDNEYPVKIFENDYIRCFYLKDNQFPICKGSYGIQLFPNQDFVTDENERVLFDLWSNIFYSQFEETLYNAECAGISYNLDSAYNCVSFKVHGFNDSILRFYKDFIQYLLDFHKQPKNYVKKHIFHVQKDDLEDRYENYFMKSPYDLNSSYWKCMVYKTGKFMKEQLTEVEIKMNDFISFTEKLFKTVRMQIYIHGNISKDTALNLCQITHDLFSEFSQPNKSIQPLQIMKIQKNQTFKFEKLITENPDEPNSGLRISYQGDQSLDPTLLLYFDLLNSIISDPFENQLRTNEQLGYVVYTNKSNRRGIHFFNFIIISETKSTKYIANRIDTFLQDFLAKDLAEFNEEKFEKVKLSYYKDQSQDFQNMNEKFKDFWNEILINQYDFDKKQKLKERIDSITHEKFLTFVQNLFKDSKRLEIHIVNKRHLDWELEHEEKITECEWYNDLFQLN